MPQASVKPAEAFTEKSFVRHPQFALRRSARLTQGRRSRGGLPAFQLKEGLHART
jgi:hypothetical protein